MTSPWWEEAVFYQIYPRSFCDASGDGVGDLEGVRRHLDHLVWLGVDALWLSPFYRSPMADFGYDVSDHCDVDPLFGTLDDFDRLLADAHRLGLKVVVDFVPNHTSDRHPWFIESRSSRDNPRRSWYWWRDPRPEPASPGERQAPPNNWRAAFAGVGAGPGSEFPPAWTWDETTGQYYLHLFLPEQPDLNWHEPAVREAMAEVLRFWMARGVDGFRADVAHGIGKNPALPDLPPNLAPIPMAALIDDPSAHSMLAGLRQVVASWPEPPERLLLGEIVLPTPEQTAAYYGTPERPELHLAFNFHPLRAPWDAAAWRSQVERVEAMLAPHGWWPTWVLSNHDNPRHRTRYGSEARARAAAVLLLSLRGTPFLYAGEELGLEDATVPRERQVDPGGRDGCRAPIPWDPSPGHGWAGGPRAWLPWPPGADKGMNVADQLADGSSTLWLYRRMIDARRGSAALRGGQLSWVEATPGVLAFERHHPGKAPGETAWPAEEAIRPTDGEDARSGGGSTDRRVVAVNFTSEPAELELAETVAGAHGWELEVSSSPRRDVWTGRRMLLEPEEAVVLKPRVG